LPLSVSAGVIDFEDLADPSFLEFSAVASRGYLVSHSGSGIDPFAEVVGASSEDALKFSGNGSMRLVTQNTSSVTISRPGGGAFDLLQFEGGESWLDSSHVWARQIKVSGQLEAGGTIAQIFTLDLHKDALTGMQQFVLGDGFRNLLAVTFSGLGATGGGPEFSLDNLVVAEEAVAVDTPSAPWLVGAGLAALATSRRRRISNAAVAR
jgi:hypothetical protein